MITPKRNIKATRGDSIGFYFQVANLDTALTSASFGVKNNPDDGKNDYVFQNTIANGQIRRMSDGITYYVKVEGTQTEDLEASEYYYDLEIQIGVDTYTILKGKLVLGWDITRKEAVISV